MASDAVVFTREINNWRIKIIHNPTNGFVYTDAYGALSPGFPCRIPQPTASGCSLRFMASHTKQILEANGTLCQASDAFIPVRAAKLIYVENDYDFFGNPIAERNYGENSPGSTYDDERFTYNTYAFNLNPGSSACPPATASPMRTACSWPKPAITTTARISPACRWARLGCMGDMMREEHLHQRSDAVPAFSHHLQTGWRSRAWPPMPASTPRNRMIPTEPGGNP